jgi:hypothetical protein
MTNEIQEMIKAYPEAAALTGMAKTVWEGSKSAARVDFSLSDKLKAKLQTLLGKDIKTIFITDSDARHIKKKHGQGETLRGQVDITPDDFALIPLVMNEFDTAIHADTDRIGNKKILFTKRLNGHVYTASVERGNSQIGVITLWKTVSKKKPDGVPSADIG